VYRVRFLKGTDEINLRQAENPFLNGSPFAYPYVYNAVDGCCYLRIGNARYHFRRGEVTGAWLDPKRRNQYVKKLNDACGEAVCEPQEGAA
jgi:hypothetical protein